MIFDVTLKANPLRLGQKRSYQVWREGELLLAASKDPEFDACRALKALGLTGRLRTRWDGETEFAMLVSIEWGASKRTAENNAVGPVTTKWEPFTPFAAKTAEAKTMEVAR